MAIIKYRPIVIGDDMTQCSVDLPHATGKSWIVK